MIVLHGENGPDNDLSVPIPEMLSQGSSESRQSTKDQPAEHKSGAAISSPWLSPLLYRDAAYLVLLVTLFMVFMTFRDYGITNDEEVQNAYGKMVLSYYLSGFKDLTSFHYIDLFYYGGLFDLLAALINKISPLGEYETRHLMGGIVGVLGLLGVWKLTRRLAGERAGFVATILLALTPAYYGSSFNNPKDIPFAVGMMWTLYFLCLLAEQFPKPGLKRVLWFGTSLGLSLSIRVGAGLAAVEALMVLTAFLGWHAYRSRSAGLILSTEGAPLIKAVFPAIPLAYALMIAFWPWSHQGLLNPFIAIQHFVHYDIHLNTLVAGQWVDARHLPRYYLPLYLVLQLPESVLIGLILAAIYLGMEIRRWRRGESAPSDVRLLQFGLIGAAAATPVLFFVILRPTAYNGIRHFLFVLPPIAVLAGIGVDLLWSEVDRRFVKRHRLFGLAVAGALLIQGWMVVVLHPYEYVYFNSLIGGVKGATGKFELDYWGSSLAEATNQLAEYLTLENGNTPPTNVYTVAVCGDKLAVSYVLPPFLKLVSSPQKSDFYIGYTEYNCDKTMDGRTIIAVKRFGANLSEVKDRRPYQPQPPPQFRNGPAKSGIFNWRRQGP